MFAQSPVPTKGKFSVTSASGKHNIGKISFSSNADANNAETSNEASSAYELTNKSNLFITVSLKRTLTSYLQQLAPALSIDSLSKVGNYQFSFYVDGKLIYQSNLLPGAPIARQQQTLLSWNKPLIDNEHEGAWWSQSAWNRFMVNGGNNALTEGRHLFKLELRSYVKTPKIKVGEVIATGELSMLVKRKPFVDLTSVTLSEVKPYDGFEVSADTFDQDKIKELKANVEASVFKHITSIIVIKNGELLIEEYFNGANRDSLHDVRSVGKSFASTLTGIAIHDGHLKSVQQQLDEFYKLKPFEHYTSGKDSVTLKSLLTMSSAFDGDDDDPNSSGNEELMYPTNNWLKFALDLPLNSNKYNGQWHYFTVGVMLLGNVLNAAVPGGLDNYAEQKLFRPLGIANYRWQYTPEHVVSTAGGIRMNSLDFAKYGQLYQNKGRWGNQQLITQDWADQSFTKHKEIPGRKNEYYGYLFWNKTYHSEGKSYETYYCSGNGGNKIFMFKDQPLVIVITATAYGNGYAHSQADQIVEQYLLPAIF
ncbi:hypothetical protein PBAL39_06676 [Pedobacter sp. BAL39]|nr:hypothetical protein PBAL39_06676 [Pedobacter sp. BAL39]